MTNKSTLPNLLACPYCNELPVYSAYPMNNNNSIFCSYCPLRVEADMILEQLAKVWNELPRRDERKTAEIALSITFNTDADKDTIHSHTFNAPQPARSATQGGVK